MNARSFKTVLFICILSCSFFANAQQTTNSIPPWQVYFSPRGGDTSAIVQTIGEAK